MIKLDDLVSLAKAGWTPKQVKEVLEMIETSPKVKEAAPEDLKQEVKIDPQPEKKEEEKENEDPIEVLKNILKEEN